MPPHGSQSTEVQAAQWALLKPEEVLSFPEGVCLVCKPKYAIYCKMK